MSFQIASNSDGGGGGNNNAQKSNWRVTKLGFETDPEDVVDGGTQYQHGIWGLVKYRDFAKKRVFTLDSLDSGIVNPVIYNTSTHTPIFPVGNPLPATTVEKDAHAGTGLNQLAPGSVQGMAVNLHNNLWNTNYPLWYPYWDGKYCPAGAPLACANANMRARFVLEFGRMGEDGAASTTPDERLSQRGHRVVVEKAVAPPEVVGKTVVSDFPTEVFL